MRKAVSALIGLLVLVACDADPAKQVKIDTTAFHEVQRDTMPRTVVGAPIILPPWKKGNCTLVPEKPGRSDFEATGKCAFRQTGNVKCQSLADDMNVYALRNAQGLATVSVFINVEFYKGPGSYTGTQMFITYQDGKDYYHWGSDSVHITVTPGEKSVVLPSNDLIAEPPNTGILKVQGTLGCDKQKPDTTRNLGPHVIIMNQP